MNKSDLICLAAANTGVAKKDTEQVVNAVLDLIAQQLAAGERVQLSGFGTFETRQREAHMGRNMKTNEPTLVPASRVPCFKASPLLKEFVGK